MYQKNLYSLQNKIKLQVQEDRNKEVLPLLKNSKMGGGHDYSDASGIASTLPSSLLKGQLRDRSPALSK